MWPFTVMKKKREQLAAREDARELKVANSQKLLLDAVTQTADAAQEVTSTLKKHLEDSMRQFELTALVLNDGLIVCDARANIVSFNPAAERIFGISAEEASRRKITSLFDIDVRHNSSHELQGAIDADGEVDAILADDSRLKVEVSMARLDRHDGTTTYLVIVHNPCLDCVDAVRYRRLFESNSNGVLVVQNNRIVAANAVAAARMGKSLDDIVDNPIDSVAGEEALAVTTTTIEWDGAPACLMTMMEPSHQFEASMVNKSASNMIVCFTPEFRVTYANNAFIARYGNGRQEVVGADVRDLFPSVEFEPSYLHMAALAPEKPHKRLYLHTVGKDGQATYQDWDNYATFDNSGAVVEYQRVGRDITAAVVNLMTR